MPAPISAKQVMTKAPKNRRKSLDPLTKQQRSERMALIRGRDTKPELAFRKLVFSLGYRYRLHDRRLPGCPDLVFASRRKAIFVHGCFWHQHDCGTYKQPASRLKFWVPKLTSNVARDAEVRRLLTKAGWKYLIVWECEIRQSPRRVARRAARFLGPIPATTSTALSHRRPIRAA